MGGWHQRVDIVGHEEEIIGEGELRQSLGPEQRLAQRHAEHQRQQRIGVIGRHDAGDAADIEQADTTPGRQALVRPAQHGCGHHKARNHVENPHADPAQRQQIGMLRDHRDHRQRAQRVNLVKPGMRGEGCGNAGAGGGGGGGKGHAARPDPARRPVAGGLTLRAGGRGMGRILNKVLRGVCRGVTPLHPDTVGVVGRFDLGATSPRRRL